MSVADEIPLPDAVDAPGFDMSEVLGFCGCGRPEDAHAHILGGLRLIDQWYRKDEPLAYDEWHSANLAHFGSSGAQYFFWYWCASEGLTEHGGSVPGWLSERGKALLALLGAAAEHTT